MFTSRNMSPACAELSFYERPMSRLERVFGWALSHLERCEERLNERSWERHRRAVRRQREDRA